MNIFAKRLKQVWFIEVYLRLILHERTKGPNFLSFSVHEGRTIYDVRVVHVHEAKPWIERSCRDVYYTKVESQARLWAAEKNRGRKEEGRQTFSTLHKTILSLYINLSPTGLFLNLFGGKYKRIVNKFDDDWFAAKFWFLKRANVCLMSVS